MRDFVTRLSRRQAAETIFRNAQDVLRTESMCGIGRYKSGRYAVLWPGLIDAWIYQGSEYLGCISRDSTVADVENLLEGA